MGLRLDKREGKMSTTNKVSELKRMLQSLLLSPEAENYFKSVPSYPDSDGPDFADLKCTHERMRALYQPLMASQLLTQLPWAAVQSLFASAQSAHNAFNQLQTNPSENIYRNFASQFDAFAYQTQLCGIPYLTTGGEALESTRTALANELDTVRESLQTLKANNTEAERLNKEVKNLVTPAVAGSLSKSFTDRRDSLAVARIVWLVLLLLFTGGVVWGLVYLGEAIATVLTGGKSAGGSMSVWVLIAMRSLFLLPVLALLGFAITQYRKERNFEEEYAHKAAVAVTLPNYGDLVQEGTVRDQIVTGAANVIFASPVARAGESGSTTDAMSAAKEIVEAAAKLLPWKR
jgi:hypothetical protein